ncbi:hypothetical protein ACFL3D_00195 [Candidatus Omnitrophota bacterium]
MKRHIKVFAMLVTTLFIASTVIAAPVEVNRFTMLAEGLGLDASQKAEFEGKFVQAIQGQADEDFAGLIADMYAAAGQEADAAAISSYYAAILELQAGATAEAAVKTLVGEVADDTLAEALVAFLATKPPVGLLFGNLQAGKDNHDYYKDTPDMDVAGVKTAMETLEAARFFDGVDVVAYAMNLVNGGYYADENALLVPAVIAELFMGEKVSALIESAIAQYPQIAEMVTGTGQKIEQLKDSGELASWLLSAFLTHESVEAENPGLDHAAVINAAESNENAQYKGFHEFMQRLYDFEVAVEIDESQAANLKDNGIVLNEEILAEGISIYVTESALQHMQGTIAGAYLGELQRQDPEKVIIGKNPAEGTKGAVVFAVPAEAEEYTGNVVVAINAEFAQNATAQYYFKSILMKLLEEAKQELDKQYDISKLAEIFGIGDDIMDVLERIISPAAKHMLTARATQIAA